MKLTDNWFIALSENEKGEMVIVKGRKDLAEFCESKKLKDRVEITWTYQPDGKGLPKEDDAELIETVEEVLRKAMEKDKLAIMTSSYTGGAEKIWVYYSRAMHVFSERLNEALAEFEQLPIKIYVEKDIDWDEYNDMLSMQDTAID